jgi:hypothetical protein
VGENHRIIFLICLEELQSLEAPTSFVFHLQLEGGSKPLFFQAATGGKLQLLNSMATNQKESTTPYFLWLQRYNYLSLPLLVVEPDYLPDSEVLAFSRVYTP